MIAKLPSKAAEDDAAYVVPEAVILPIKGRDQTYSCLINRYGIAVSRARQG